MPDMLTFWIVGVGKFGAMAADRLGRMHRNSHMVLIDPVNEHLIKAKGINRSLEEADGVTFLLHHLHPGKGPDWIVPALPIHLLAQWVIAELKADGCDRIKIPEPIIEGLPNCIVGKSGDLYVSLADFICPDDCPEPRDVCHLTGQKREKNMYDLLSETGFPGFHTIVVRSRQLACGVGGYRPESLFHALKQVSESRNNTLLCTACRCHGVMTGVKSILRKGVC
jgi:hypothetical protein